MLLVVTVVALKALAAVCGGEARISAQRYEDDSGQKTPSATLFGEAKDQAVCFDYTHTLTPYSPGDAICYIDLRPAHMPGEGGKPLYQNNT